MAPGMDKNFEQRVKAVLRELKYDYLRQRRDLLIPVHEGKRPVAFLRPISRDMEGDEAEYLDLLTAWRRDNWQAYPTVFTVTREGTRKWVAAQLIERADRILFMIVTPDFRPIGHLGLSNFDFQQQEAEIDNVVRGVSGCLPGIMTAALHALTGWAFGTLGVQRLVLRVFFDNPRAIRLYEREGFRGVRQIPLKKVVDGDVTRFVEIADLAADKADRIFYLMEKGRPSGLAEEGMCAK